MAYLMINAKTFAISVAYIGLPYIWQKHFYIRKWKKSEIFLQIHEFWDISDVNWFEWSLFDISVKLVKS